MTNNPLEIAEILTFVFLELPDFSCIVRSARVCKFWFACMRTVLQRFPRRMLQSYVRRYKVSEITAERLPKTTYLMKKVFKVRTLPLLPNNIIHGICHRTYRGGIVEKFVFNFGFLASHDKHDTLSTKMQADNGIIDFMNNRKYPMVYTASFRAGNWLIRTYPLGDEKTWWIMSLTFYKQFGCSPSQKIYEDGPTARRRLQEYLWQNYFRYGLRLEYYPDPRDVLS
jgi:hypothetical protein